MSKKKSTDVKKRKQQGTQPNKRQGKPVQQPEKHSEKQPDGQQIKQPEKHRQEKQLEQRQEKQPNKRQGKPVQQPEKHQEKHSQKQLEKRLDKRRGKQPQKKRQRNQTVKYQDKQQGIRKWREIFYNCPYLLAVACTSLAVMVYSDEIGIRAIAREAEAAAAQVMGDGVTTQDPSVETMAQQPAMEATDLETLDGNEGENVENAGECKESKNEIEENNDFLNDYEIEETAEETDKEIKGVTKFETYEPQETDSRYYSDAGKTALTTEYPYSMENDSYFNDAAFLGDSRTLGISDYAGLDAADFYCDSGMTIFKLLEADGVTYQKTGEKVDLSQVLQQKNYGKIYIMLGMNELGYGNTQMYFEKYREVVKQIKEWQPEALIFIMANLHVSREKNNAETEFNNININDKNAASARLANGTDIFYLDANPLFTDAEGFLNAELTFDGVHLYAQHYDVWRQFLLEHAVEPKIETAEEAEGEHGENPFK